MITKRLITLLLAAAMLSFCLLPLTGCKQKQTEPSNPFDEGMTMPANNDSNANGNIIDSIVADRFFGASDYDASALHGEKKLYRGYHSNPAQYEPINNIAIYWDTYNVRSFDVTNPTESDYLCFDPLCEHMFVESCTAWLESYGVLSDPDDFDSDIIYYPALLLIDRYDYKEAPVVYMSFRRHPYFFVSDVMYEREAVYCIERFDMTTGTRTVVADNIEETIDSITTYGEYVYFTAIDADDNRSICRVSKAGGSIERLCEPKEVTYELLDVVDDKLYYLVDGHYLNRCDLALSESEELFDLTELKGNDSEAITRYRTVKSGYIYYTSDIVEVFDNVSVDYVIGTKGNIYRVPLNDPTASPEKVLEDVSIYDIAFTDDTLFYQPFAYDIEAAGEDETLFATELTDGTIRALDLNTLEVTSICENTGLWIFFKNTINCEDDCITFTARYGDGEWEDMANDTYNTLIGRKSGGVEIWRKRK